MSITGMHPVVAQGEWVLTHGFGLYLAERTITDRHAKGKSIVLGALETAMRFESKAAAERWRREHGDVFDSFNGLTPHRLRNGQH